MRVIILEDGAMLSDITCGREAIYIGCGDECQILLPDSRVAAQQAVLLPESPHGWALEQLDPSIEIQLNATTVTRRVLLKTADEIHISNFVLRVFPDAEDHSSASGTTHLTYGAGVAHGPPMRVESGVARFQFEKFAQSKLPPTAIIKKVEEPLLIQASQVSSAAKVSLRASQCVTVEALMDVILRSLFDVFGAHRVWIGIRRVNYGAMEYVEGRVNSGQTFELPEVGEQVKPRVLDRAQFVVIPMVSPEMPVSVLAGPLAGPDGTLGMAYLDTGDSGRKFEPRDLDEFIVVTSLLAVQLDAVFKAIARSRAATIEGQVSVAHEIQARLTPRKLPQWEELQFGAFREPGRERTGDIYDVVRIANGQAAILIAQTSASGAWPSMLITQAQTAFRSAIMHLDPPNVCMRILNWLLYDGNRDHPLACFVATIDPKSGEVKYSCAGHVGAFIIGQRGEERRLAALTVNEPLGFDKSANFDLYQETLAPGETLALFTAGVTTARNGKGEAFGEDRFVSLLCDGFGQLASAMLKEMLSDLQGFTEGGQQPDDITVILAHRVED